ncbi:hypothetical protein BC830DRAFT_104587 [Chytriomyces sp. MP71]|nr:hypothetical protein BC830DRAFT_104587 [Chytriomyces sp. MP71]
MSLSTSCSNALQLRQSAMTECAGAAVCLCSSRGNSADTADIPGACASDKSALWIQQYASAAAGQISSCSAVASQHLTPLSSGIVIGIIIGAAIVLLTLTSAVVSAHSKRLRVRREKWKKEQRDKNPELAVAYAAARNLPAPLYQPFEFVNLPSSPPVAPSLPVLPQPPLREQFAFTGSSSSTPLTGSSSITDSSHPSLGGVIPLKQSHTRNLNTTIIEKASLSSATSTVQDTSSQIGPLPLKGSHKDNMSPEMLEKSKLGSNTSGVDAVVPEDASKPNEYEEAPPSYS